MFRPERRSNLPRMLLSPKNIGGTAKKPKRKVRKVIKALDKLNQDLHPKALKKGFRLQSHIERLISVYGEIDSINRQIKNVKSKDMKKILTDSLIDAKERRNSLISLINEFADPEGLWLKKKKGRLVVKRKR